MAAIDLHAHVIPPSLLDAARTNRPWHGLSAAMSDTGAVRVSDGSRAFTLSPSQSRDDLTRRIARMDAARVNIQVLSMTWRLFRYEAPVEAAVAAAEQYNEDLAQILAAEPARFMGFMHLPLQDPLASVRMLERWLVVPGVVGACVGTDVDGREWDHPTLFPVLEAAAALGAVLFLHPGDRREDTRLGRFHLRNLIGNPLETTIAIASLIFSGVLDRLPEAKLVFSHGGGFAAAAAGRFDHGYRARAEPREHARELPSAYLRRLYFDSITHSEQGLRALIDVVGVDHVVLGSDDPADMGVARPVDFIDGCSWLPDPYRERILEGNVRALLGMEPRAD